MDTPKLRIRVPDGRTVLATVELDGRRLPATRVAFDTGEDINGLVKVRVEFYADLELETDVPLVATGIEPVPA